MGVAEHYRRFDGFDPVERSRVDYAGGPRLVPEQTRRVDQQRGVGEPLQERPRHAVVGQRVRDDRRMRVMSQNRVFRVRYQRRRRHVDQRQVQLGGQARDPLRGHELDDDHVEVRPRARDDRPRHVVLVNRRERVPAVVMDEVDQVRVPGEQVVHVAYVQPHQRLDVFGHVHFRVVLPVALGNRREHGDVMAVIGQRAQNAFHEVPVALSRDRRDRQNPFAVHR